ncbi:MAG TPA: enolase C-terminal domain-like protein [Methylomirabilota bacterium]|nr:enolase C-terminal domain-like protein [Methylomirabilota bacterium]
MKISDVTLTLFAWGGIPATTYGRHTGRFSGSSELGLLTLRTDDGLEGHAFLGSAMRGAALDAHSLLRVLKPLVLGQDPLDRERLWQAMWQRSRSTTLRAIGAVDVALWDLGGKIAGLPIHRLLGGYRESVPAYASSAVLGSVEAYAEEAARFKAEGWRAYKIHPPTEPATDIAVCEAVRRAVGDGYTVMLDSTWAYQYPEALRVGRVAEALDFHWYEDPLADDDVYNYVKLKQQLAIPILATEYAPGGFTALAPWIVARATDYLRGDVAVKGGITPLVKSAHLAEAFHMNFEIHHGGNSLNNVANLHVTMAIRNCEFFEVLLPAAAQKYGLARDIEVDGAGLVHAPAGPGLGAAIDFELIARQKTAVLD